MCTLSIRQSQNALNITMNRDERLDRPAEIAPFVWESGMIAPQDEQSGGTWIGVHPETRRWACLLNGYSDHDQTHKPVKSRGAIIPDLLASGHDFTILEKGLESYHSFRLIYGDADHIHEALWDGEVLMKDTPQLANHWLFRSSSSWQQDEVLCYRDAVFRRWDETCLTQANIPSFHTSQDQGHETSSILMRRQNPARATTSITAITLNNDDTRVDYFSSRQDNDLTLRPLNKDDIEDQNVRTILF